MKVKYLLAIIILMFASTTFAQSQYLHKGESAFEIGFNYQANEGDISDIGFFSLGFGSHGKANVKFLIGRVDEVMVYGAGIELFIVKQNIRRNIPISFGLDLQSTVSKGYGQISTSFTVGGFINRDFAFSKNAGVTPFISVGYTDAEVWNGRLTGGGFTLYFKEDSIASIRTGYYVTELYNALELSISIIII